MADYQQLLDQTANEISDTILRRMDSAHIPNDPANRDRQSYETWLSEGNVPDPPDPPPEPPAPEPTELAAHPEDPMDACTKAYTDTKIATEIATAVAPLQDALLDIQRRLAGRM
jgi:hypothetical protein